MEVLQLLVAANAIIPLLGLILFAGVVWYGIHSARTGFEPVELPDDPSLNSLKTMSHVSYGCMAASAIFPIVGFVSVVLDLVNRGKGNPLLESHIRWRLRSFIFAFVWSLIGMVTVFFYGLGWAIIIIVVFWFVFRCVKGWVSFLEQRPVYPIE